MNKIENGTGSSYTGHGIYPAPSTGTIIGDKCEAEVGLIAKQYPGSMFVTKEDVKEPVGNKYQDAWERIKICLELNRQTEDIEIMEECFDELYSIIKDLKEKSNE